MSATGATVDDNTGLLLLITPTQYDALENLYFGIGDVCRLCYKR